MPLKDYLLDHRGDAALAELFDLACGRRPAEELYDLRADPYALHSVALYPEHANVLQALREQTTQWVRDTADPRAAGGGAYDAFDTHPCFGGVDPQRKAKAATRP